jgi:hypothetical protein
MVLKGHPPDQIPRVQLVPPSWGPPASTPASGPEPHLLPLLSTNPNNIELDAAAAGLLPAAAAAAAEGRGLAQRRVDGVRVRWGLRPWSCACCCGP